MTQTSREFVQNLYNSLYQREPDQTGLDYFTDRLESGYFTRAQVAHDFLVGEEYADTPEIISRLYFATFERSPDYAGLNYWNDVIRNGGKLTNIADIFTHSPEFVDMYGGSLDPAGFLTILYRNVMGRQPDDAGLTFWQNRMNEGLDRGSVLLGFSESTEYKSITYWPVKAVAMYRALAGRTPSDAELSGMPQDLVKLAIQASIATSGSSIGGIAITYSSNTFQESSVNDGSISNTITLKLTGDTFKGSAGKLGKITNTPPGLTAVLTKQDDTTALLSLSGKATAHNATNDIHNLTVTLGDADFISGKASSVSGATISNLDVRFIDIPAYVSSTTLYLTGTVGGTINANLTIPLVTLAGKVVTLDSGVLEDAVNIDLSGITGISSTLKTTANGLITLKGNEADNDLVLSALGDIVEGAGGDDNVSCGSGIDKIKFSNTASANGQDSITSFILGATGDVLNFSAFLNKTGTGKIATVDADGIITAAAAWSNGDVLTVQGNGLTTPEKIAALFGNGLPFAAPVGASKSVLISADIVGDASIWFITNQTDTTSITESEVQLVGVLTEIHNLKLLGFDQKNFA